MDDLDSAQVDADTNGFSLIDASASDDDFLLLASSEAKTVDNQGDIFAGGAHLDKPSELSAVHRSTKLGKCNLRKSLAWDGVLDAEELSSIMEGAECGPNQNNQLLGIEAELSKSTDSIATFESDSLSLESLEADLFCDIRASMKRRSKSSYSGNSGVESGNGSAKIVQPSSGNMPKITSRKPNPAVQVPTRMLKPISISKQVIKPVVRVRESSSTLPQPPEAVGKPSLEGTATSKRMSVGAGHTKSEKISSVGHIKGVGKEALISKSPRQVISRNTIQKAPASSKLSSASLVMNRTAICCSHSSYDNSSSSSPENIRRSQSDALRKKINKDANLAPGSKIGTPSRVPVKDKFLPGDCQLSAYVKSTSKLSPSISPASSISEWSTESSSSTATVNQKHGGLKQCSTPEDINAAQNMLSQSAKQPSTGNAVSLARPGSAKPSGLRLPSPKIGFFDGGKTGTKTPSGSARTRSALPTNLPRSTAGNRSPFGPANKTKPSSVARVSTSALRTGKLEPKKSHGSPKSTEQLQDCSVVLPSHDSGTLSSIQVEESEKQIETRDHNTDVLGESQISFQSETVLKNEETCSSAIPPCPQKSSGCKQYKKSLIVTCSSSLPDMGISQGTRTPFAVKNSVFDVVEATNEAFLKIDAMPSLEKHQKENY